MLYRSFDGALGAEDFSPNGLRTGEVGLVTAVGDWLLWRVAGFSSGSMTCAGRVTLEDEGFEDSMSSSSTSSIMTDGIFPFLRLEERADFFCFFVGDSSSSSTT